MGIPARRPARRSPLIGIGAIGPPGGGEGNGDRYACASAGVILLICSGVKPRVCSSAFIPFVIMNGTPAALGAGQSGRTTLSEGTGGLRGCSSQYLCQFSMLAR